MTAELINTDTGEVIEPMTQTEARHTTVQIRDGLEDMADIYDAVMPMIRNAMTRQAWKALGYRSVGEYISEEFGGALHRLGVEARRGVVKELASAGISTRAIAPVVGASQSTVSDDLRATDQNRSVEDDHDPTPVVGLNGKKYQRPAPQPKPSPIRPLQETPEERERREIEQGRRDTCTRIAECVRFLDGGREYGQIFLDGFYPHEADYLAPGMRLTRARIDSCIEFLQTIREGVDR